MIGWNILCLWFRSSWQFVQIWLPKIVSLTLIQNYRTAKRMHYLRSWIYAAISTQREQNRPTKRIYIFFFWLNCHSWHMIEMNFSLRCIRLLAWEHEKLTRFFLLAQSNTFIYILLQQNDALFCNWYLCIFWLG